MNELNPYAPPETNPIPPTAGTEPPLASRWIRLGAQVIDGVLLFVLCVPVLWALSRLGIVSSPFVPRANGFTVRVQGLYGYVIWTCVWVVVNWHMLQNGQTIGKRLTRLRIVRKSGEPIPALRILTHRFLPLQLLGMLTGLPYLGGLAALVICVDALLIFRTGRNTLHDDIADTKVVKLS